MVSSIAEDIVVVGIFFGAALVICLQWLANGRLREQASTSAQAMEQVHQLLDQAPLGLAILDRELRFVYINRLLAEINGIPAAGHVGKTLQQIVPDLSADAEDSFNDVVRSGRPLRGIILTGTTAAQPGVLRTWRESVYPRRDQHGNVVGVAVSVEEITEQQRLLEELHTSEVLKQRRASELESVMRAVPAAVFIAHDRACVQVSMNPEGERLLRVGPGESPSVSAPGKRPFEVRRGGVLVPVEQLPLQRAAARGEVVRGEDYTVHFENGDFIHVTVNAVPLTDEHGAVMGAVAAFVDTTRSSVRLHELRREAGRKAEEMAALAAGLREPLNAIGAGLATLRAGATQPATAEACLAMSGQVAQALAHVEEALEGGERRAALAEG